MKPARTERRVYRPAFSSLHRTKVVCPGLTQQNHRVWARLSQIRSLCAHRPSPASKAIFSGAESAARSQSWPTARSVTECASDLRCPSGRRSQPPGKCDSGIPAARPQLAPQARGHHRRGGGRSFPVPRYRHFRCGSGNHLRELSTAIGKSGWVVLFSPGWRPPVFQAGGRVFSRRAGVRWPAGSPPCLPGPRPAGVSRPWPALGGRGGAAGCRRWRWRGSWA